MMRISARVAAAAALATLLVTAAPAFGAGSGATVTNASGPDYVYGSGNPFANAHVEIHGVQSANGTTSVTLNVSGIDPAVAGQTFPAHVHINACGTDPVAAGGHYKSDPSVTTPVESNEIWLDFTVTDGGTGRARAERPWAFTSSAQAVVIHASTSSTRLVCTNALFHS